MLSDFIDERILYVLRYDLGGTPVTADFLVDLLNFYTDDKRWSDIPDANKIFHVKESLIRLMREKKISETRQLVGTSSRDDIQTTKKKRESVYRYI